jgi:hypothetical protein
MDGSMEMPAIDHPILQLSNPFFGFLSSLGWTKIADGETWFGRFPVGFFYDWKP